MRRSELDADPLWQFLAWFDAARDAGVPVPETMTLATAAYDGRPSARQVLLKGSDTRGFVFYSGYDSRKGKELAETLMPRCSSTGRPWSARCASRAVSSG